MKPWLDPFEAELRVTVELIERLRAERDALAEAAKEIVAWPKSCGLDDPVQAVGRLTERTEPQGDLYGMRLTTARQILRDALDKLGENK